MNIPVASLDIGADFDIIGFKKVPFSIDSPSLGPQGIIKPSHPGYSFLVVPIFEFRCSACGSKFDLLVGMTQERDDAKCPKCGSAEVKRLVSRFRRGRSEEARLDELSDRVETWGEPESPSEMRETLKEMGRALDDDASEEMEQLFEAEHENP
jgi:putative FmdB family regulatory protein